MGMGTPTESPSTEAHLNDMAAHTIVEDSGGFVCVNTKKAKQKNKKKLQTVLLMLAFGDRLVKFPDAQTLSEREKITIFQKAQYRQNYSNMTLKR